MTRLPAAPAWPAGVRSGGVVATLLGLALGAHAQSAAVGDDVDAQGWAYRVRSDRHADALPLASLGNIAPRQLAPRGGRNLAYVDDQARVDRQLGAWTWSLLARERSSVATDAASLAVARALDGGSPLPPAQQSVALRYRDFAGAGLAVQHRWPLSSTWQLQLGLQALVLGRARDSRLAGDVQLSPANALQTLDLQLDRLDSRMRPPFFAPPANHGQAWLGSVALQGRWADGGVKLALDDLGWLFWSGLPRQQATLSSDTAAVDALGYTVLLPLAQGRYTPASSRQFAPLQGSLSVWWQWQPRWRLGATVRGWAGSGPLPALRLDTDLAGAAGRWSVGGEWQLHERRLVAHAAWRGWQLQLGTDTLGGQAHSRLVGLAWQSSVGAGR